MTVGVVTRTHRRLQGVWKTTPKTCGKQGKNSGRYRFEALRGPLYLAAGVSYQRRGRRRERVRRQ